jgi:uncharacterized protein YjiS (DUF1127 family)
MSLEEKTRHHSGLGQYAFENEALSDAGQWSNEGAKATVSQASAAPIAVDGFAGSDEKSSDATGGKSEREPAKVFRASAFFLMAIGSLPRFSRQRRKRAETRQALLQLDDHLLRDIGLNRWTITHM